MLAGNRVALVLEGGFDADGYAALRRCLEGAGAEVMILSSDSWGEISDSAGTYRVKPDRSYSEAQQNDFDALIVGDEASARTAQSRPDACSLVSEAVRSAKPVATIGEGAALLVCADVLKGRKVAANQSLADLIRASGGMFKERSLVIDGNIISAKDAAYSEDVCKALSDALRGRPAKAA